MDLWTLGVRFNLGVELGQLAIIAAVVGLRRLLTGLRLDRDWMRRGLIYAMGGLAACWSLDLTRATPPLMSLKS